MGFIVKGRDTRMQEIVMYPLVKVSASKYDHVDPKVRWAVSEKVFWREVTDRIVDQIRYPALDKINRPSTFMPR